MDQIAIDQRTALVAEFANWLTRHGHADAEHALLIAGNLVVPAWAKGDDLQKWTAEWGRAKQAARPIGLMMDKHEAITRPVRERIIADLESKGLAEAADWARWMVWWWHTAEQRSERFARELRKLTKE